MYLIFYIGGTHTKGNRYFYARKKIPSFIIIKHEIRIFQHDIVLISYHLGFILTQKYIILITMWSMLLIYSVMYIESVSST